MNFIRIHRENYIYSKLNFLLILSKINKHNYKYHKKENKMEKQLNRLKKTQKVLFKDAIEIEKHKISLFEAPTGFGKSVIVNTIAEYLASEKKKKIIITTTTNHLAIEQLKLFKDERFDFAKDLIIDVVVGKENYFSPNNITQEVYDYIDKEQLDNYIANIVDNDGYLIETLFDNVDIEEPNKKIVQNLIHLKNNDNTHLATFDDLDISITNYAYLFTNVFFVKDFDISNYIIVADEVHQLVETAENLLTNSFSLFRFKNLLNQLISKTSSNLKIEKYLTNLESESTLLLNKYSNSSYAGTFYSLNQTGYGMIDDIKEKLLFKNNDDLKPANSKSKEKKSIDSILKDTVENSNNEALKTIFKMYKKEKSELFGIINAPQDVTVYMSPSKGYPTLNASKGDIRGWLLTFFWDKVETFIGLSATIKANKEDEQAFNRLGISRGTFQNWLDKIETVEKFLNTFQRFPSKDDKEYLKLVEFLEIQKKGYVEGFLTHEKENILINKFGYSFFSGLIKGELKEEENRVTHIKYGVKDFAPIFSPSQAKTYLPSKDLIKPKLQEDEDENEWFNMVATNIAKYHENKNSMVICGSFYEVEKITEILKILLPDNNIISAKRNSPAVQVIEDFKRNGGIAIVTRNYGTGVNLPKKLLEKLFIIKLPFPIFTTKKWVDIKLQDKKFNTSFYHSLYQNEMFTTFRQWIGRLIRTEDDKGELYILDSRYWEVKNHKTLEYWISKMSIIQKERIEYIPNTTKHINIEEENILGKINCFKCDSFDESLKDYLIKNIEYISNHKKVPLLKSNSLELNKRLMKIKKKFEEHLK